MKRRRLIGLLVSVLLMVPQLAAVPLAAQTSDPVGLLRVTTDPAVASQILIDGAPADSWGLSWVKVPVGDS